MMFIFFFLFTMVSRVIYDAEDFAGNKDSSSNPAQPVVSV